MSSAVLADSHPGLSIELTGDAVASHTVVVVGNPNVGKTTLFNRLTGSSGRVGNYPGITVELETAPLELDGGTVDLIDVPGSYSLSARSQEEQVALFACLGLGGQPRPSLAVVVMGAEQLERNLYLALQIVEFQIPVLLVLTMMDEVAERPPLAEAVGATFGVPCLAVNGRTGEGISQLKLMIDAELQTTRLGDVRVDYPKGTCLDRDTIAERLPTGLRRNVEHDRAMALWALLSLSSDDELVVPSELRSLCAEVRAASAAAGRDIDLEVVSARYSSIERSARGAYDAPRPSQSSPSWTERVDRVLLHPVLGFIGFLALMFTVFQALFSWADPFIELIEDAIGWSQRTAAAVLPDSIFTELFTEAVLGGVGNVIVFLPQILLLFFLIGLLEDCGYMARVAYLMDRLLKSVGLHGKAFVPMLSGMACAVPAVMATRTMERKRDRLLTMMVVPLMSCSARLPVYTLLVGALVPPGLLAGVFPVHGVLMVGLYLFSTLMALLAAFVLGRTVVKGTSVPLLLELPRYRIPSLRTIALMMWRRAREFLVEAGTVILGFTMLLWVLLSFPKPPMDAETIDVAQTTTVSAATDTRVQAPPDVAIEHSFGGRLGKFVAPAMQPLGFDWKLTIGILGAFSAREVFVSTLGLVFGIGDAEADEGLSLRAKLAREKNVDGTAAYTPLVALSLMVFFALACQCMSTIAVVKRETGGYKWPAFLFTYMTVLAYVASFVVYQGGKLLGF